MHEQPRRILCKLIKQYGPELHADARRTEALLRDLCNDYPREIFVLINAQKQQVPADLLRAPRWMPQQALATQLVRRLQEQLALTEEAASWAVETWAMALEIQPAPPDRALDWLKQHVPTSQSLQPAVRFIDHLTNLGERLLHNFDVKLIYENFINRAQIKIRTARWFGWLWHSLLRSPVRIAIVLIICAAFVVGAVNRNISSSQPSLSVVDQLEIVYPLPRTAWVSEDQLTIRSGPTTGATARGFLKAGQALTVVKFSEDGQWSHISAPADGWVNNAYILFRYEDAPGVYTMIKVEHAKITSDHLHVRSGPDVRFTIAGNLDEGQVIEILATSQDGHWKQIVTPIRGWVSTEFVQVSATCGDKLKERVARVSNLRSSFLLIVQGIMSVTRVQNS